jgi:hypothetical protein
MKLPNKSPEERLPNPTPAQTSAADKLAQLSRRVSEESLRVNAEFAAIEQDPDD